MKICLAGTSSFLGRIDLDKSDYILESFYYIKDWQIPMIKSKKLFLLDSGAFSFMNTKSTRVENLEEYLNKLASFVVKNDVKNFFNIDLETVIGVEKSYRLRRLLEEKTQRKCIPVFHACMGLNSYKELVKEYDYIAIGTIADFNKRQDILKKLLFLALENNCKVHGLGYTRLEEVKTMPFYSVDSTSWTCGNRFGYIYQFKDGNMNKIHRPAGKRLKSSKAISHNWLEWCKYQKYIDMAYRSVL